MVAGSAIMDYHKVANHVSAEQYVQDVVVGKRFDTNLSKQLKMGFRALALIPNYVEDDWRVLGWGVTIVWNNPDYQPSVTVTKPYWMTPYLVELKPKRELQPAL
jgi:hypothetical protein